jgi:hypothetical protein
MKPAATREQIAAKARTQTMQIFLAQSNDLLDLSKIRGAKLPALLLSAVLVTATTTVPIEAIAGQESETTVLSVSDSSSRSITGSSRRSITGSSSRSITGSSSRSITGSSRRSITGSSSRGYITGAASNLVNASMIVFGPITGIASESITVMGQRFEISADFSLTLSAQTEIGRLAFVEAIAEDQSFIAQAVHIGTSYSIPGASGVYVSGVVVRVDHELGLLAVGDLEIDINATGVLDSIAIGASIIVVGTQPLLGGVVYGSSLQSSQQEDSSNSAFLLMSISDNI